MKVYTKDKKKHAKRSLAWVWWRQTIS